MVWIKFLSAKVNKTMADYDVIVVGGGTVGISIAYGLTRLGQKTAVFDQGDVAVRAAVGNFGLIWVQGKGIGSPAYANWTRRSACDGRA